MTNDNNETEQWLRVGALYLVTREHGVFLLKTLSSGDDSVHKVVRTTQGDIVLITEFVTRSLRRSVDNTSKYTKVEWYRGLFLPKSTGSTNDVAHVTIEYQNTSGLVLFNPEIEL